MDCPSGAISSETRLADVTARDAEPFVEAELALIVAEPVATPVASPVWSIVATFVELEPQVALIVTSVELPSEKIPFAENACVMPIATEAVAGVTTIEWS